MNIDLALLSILTMLIPLGMTGLGIVALFFRSLYHQTGRWLGILTVIVSLVLLGMSILMLVAPSTDYPKDFPLSLQPVVTIDFHLDQLSVFFILLVNVITLAASWNALAYLSDVQAENIWQQPVMFHMLVNLFHFTMLLVPLVDNLVGVWIAIELTTLGSAFLIAYQRKRSSWEATWKYLIITSTGIILALLGTIFLAKAVPLPVLDELLPEERDRVMNWTYLMKLAQGEQLIPTFVWFAFLFALIGYGTKAGLAPMHTWLPDGHGEAPSPISALLSGVLLKSALYVILRFYTLTNIVLGQNLWTSIALLGIGSLSLLVATPFILKENPFKRVLAYHSLEHMGIITFGLGLGGPIAIFGAVLHMFNHAITKALMFLAFGNVMKQYEKHGISQENIRGIFRSMPITGGILTLGGLALVGTPPFNIFMSEFIILWGALTRFWSEDKSLFPGFSEQIVIGAVILFIISTTLIFYGLMKHLGKLVLGKMDGDRRLKDRGWAETGPLVILFLLMLVLGVWVLPLLANIINESVIIILNQV